MEEKKVFKFFVFGGLWFDKVNGNTYNSAKILDEDGYVVGYTPFTYGYGSQYLVEASDYLKDHQIGGDNPKIINVGSAYMNKKDVKNGWF